MRRFTGPLPFSIEPHRQKAGAQGFEPCRAALETACSPRSTLLFKGVRGESNPPPRPSQGRMQTVTPQTPSISSPGWIRTSDLSHVTGMSCPLNDGTVSTPTRIRTRNASFEARYDGPFHHRGVKRKARESNPHLRWENRLSRAARPTVSGYLPKWTHRESNPDYQSAELVSSRWTMSPQSGEWGSNPRSPAPKAGGLPLSYPL